MSDRQTILSKMKENPDVSVLIVGGGVNGIGTFLDLAHQGVDVYLVDRADYASGATAASSHMAHGGIRYLENGEFRLVREAVNERNRMIVNAPHIVEPLPTTIPIFKALSGMFNAPMKFLGLLDKPAERGIAVIKIGLMMYDAYTAQNRQTPTHSVMGRKESLEKYPKLNPDIIYTATYYDGHIQQPERYCVEMLSDAMAASDKVLALNYVSAAGAEGDTVTLRDEINGETFTVKPKVVINAAGPWIDFANDAMGLDTQFIGGTKGSHLVIDHQELHDACGGSEMFFENDDGRIVLCFPFGPGRVLAGTTDLYVEHPDEAVCDDEEIAYILGLLPKVFPTITVDRKDVVFTYCGVRPLAYQDANTTGQITRDHKIQTLEADEIGLSFPVLSLVGGKWTSYRAFSEHTADDVLKRLSMARRTSTETLAIGGGKNYPREDARQAAWLNSVAKETGLPEERVRTLFERYGTGAAAIAEFLAQGDDQPLTDNPSYTRREIQWITENEYVVHLDDILLRRTMLPMWGTMSEALLTEMADIAGEVLGWDETDRKDEVARTTSILTRKHRVNLSGDTEPALV